LLQRRLKTVHWSGHLGRSSWLRSEFFNLYVKQTKVDDGIFAHQQLAPGVMCWMFVNRALGDRPFDARQCRLMALLNRELARLRGTKLAPSGEISVTELPPRLREVLIRLMQGDSEKQIAQRLAISPHTVHDYIKQMHARFGVRSRGELLARCRNYWPVLELLASGQGGSVGSDPPPADPAIVDLCSSPVPGNGKRRCFREDDGG
jgi:DNA-binding CsgD family transcriptional regulator